MHLLFVFANICQTNFVRQQLQVGERIALLVYTLVVIHKIRMSMFICIGHSLGAHICGIAGHRLIHYTDINGVVKGLAFSLIIGLDPAKILFQKDVTVHGDRLDKFDAIIVIIFHSAGGYYGVEIPIGSVDVFNNGGMEQPGCNTIRAPYPTGTYLSLILF